MVILLFAEALFEFFLEVADRFVGHYALRDSHGEGRAFSVFTLHADLSVHHIEEHLGDRKSEARSLLGAVTHEIETFEFCKEPSEIFLADTYSRILNFNDKVDKGLSVLGAIRSDTGYLK